MRPAFRTQVAALGAFVGGCFLFPGVDHLDENAGATDGAITSDSGSSEEVGTLLEGGASGTCGAGSFCDDFELGNTSRWDGTPITQDGSEVTVVPIAAPLSPNGASAKALRANAPIADARAYLVKNLNPAPGAALAMRAKIHLAAAPTGGHWVDLLSFRTSGKTQRANLRLEDNWEFRAILGNGADSALGSIDVVFSGANRWTCFEIDTLFGDKAALFIDGTSRGTFPFPKSGSEVFGELRLGYVQGEVPLEVFFDDVRVEEVSGIAVLPATPLIGCP